MTFIHISTSIAMIIMILLLQVKSVTSNVNDEDSITSQLLLSSSSVQLRQLNGCSGREKCLPQCRHQLSSFTLIDATTHMDIQPLSNYTKSDIVSELLNIRINENQCDSSSATKIEGVIVIFDNNTTLRRCERHIPYSVFGNPRTLLRKKYYGVTIPVGTHTITATPYPGHKCTGTPGIPLIQSFTVS